MKSKFTIILLMLCVYGVTSVAQDSNPTLYSVATSGGDASSSEGSISFSVGQAAYHTYSGTDATIAQGVQQAYEIFIVTDVETTKDPELKIVVYPNPVKDIIVLQIENESLKNSSCQLLDIKGKLIFSQEITTTETTILMNDLVPAVYFLNVFSSETLIKTFKIIKN